MRLPSISFHVVIVILGLFLMLVVIGYVIWDARQDPFAQTLWPMPAGNPEQGRAAIQRHGCGACHVIEGIRRSNGRVGPKLIDLHEQAYIGGVLPNNPDNLAAWIMNPKVHSPETAMPNLDITQEEAHDMAAYLLRESLPDR